jgi:glycine cleavage system aminomethyltransferase T
MSTGSLQAAIDAAGSAVDVVRNAEARPFTFPIQAEFTNWRSEQAAWRDTVALLDQSHHMTDLFVSGPDATKFFSWLGANSLAAYRPGRAKQFVAVNHGGYVIGDGILFHFGENDFNLVTTTLADWIEYNVATGGWDVRLVRDNHSMARVGDPRLFRYELQGPNAFKVVEKVTGQPAPDLKFFHMGELTIAGLNVGVLRHGMAGQPGFELWGPWEHGTTVLDKLLADGAEFGITRAGARAYSTANLGSGWIPSPPPAIFDEELRGYREWLNASNVGSFGGSFDSPDITDYYVTPWDIGLGRSVSFDHDFLGKEALERHAGNKRRTKVTLVWNPQDFAAATESFFDQDRLPGKFIELPKARYAQFPTDRVLRDGTDVGISYDSGYLANERAFISLAAIDVEQAVPGTEVTVVWGENPNTRKPQVEPHRQLTIRATVAPAPYFEHARAAYRAG